MKSNAIFLDNHVNLYGYPPLSYYYDAGVTGAKWLKLDTDPPDSL